MLLIILAVCAAALWLAVWLAFGAIIATIFVAVQSVLAGFCLLWVNAIERHDRRQQAARGGIPTIGGTIAVPRAAALPTSYRARRPDVFDTTTRLRSRRSTRP